MEHFTPVGPFSPHRNFHEWFRKNHRHYQDVEYIVYATGDVQTQTSDGYIENYYEVHIFFRPFYYYNSGFDNPRIHQGQDGEITEFENLYFQKMWRQNTPVDKLASSQDLSQILDNWKNHEGVPGGSGNNWIFNPDSTQRWNDIVLERDSDCRSVWGDERIRDMMLESLAAHDIYFETINFRNINYK